MLVNSSEQDRDAMFMKEARRRIAKNSPNQDRSQDPRCQEMSLEKSGPVLDVFVSEDQGLGYEEAVELHSGHVDRQNSNQK